MLPVDPSIEQLRSEILTTRDLGEFGSRIEGMMESCFRQLAIRLVLMIVVWGAVLLVIVKTVKP